MRHRPLLPGFIQTAENQSPIDRPPPPARATWEPSTSLRPEPPIIHSHSYVLFLFLAWQHPARNGVIRAGPHCVRCVQIGPLGFVHWRTGARLTTLRTKPRAMNE